MTGRKALATLALIGSLAGCYNLDLGLAPNDGWNTSSGGCWFCINFTLVTHNWATAILKGDTIRVSVLSTAGHDVGSNWRVVGTALALVDADSLTASITRRSTSVLVKGVASGMSTVRATAADSALDGSIELKVVDSAGITAINFNTSAGPIITVGSEWGFVGQLMTGAEMVAGTPTSVTISDTTVLQLMAQPVWYPFPNNYMMRAKKAGDAEITLRFLDVRRTVTFTVTP